MKRPVGRPTKYNDEILVLTRAYIDSYQTMGDLFPSIAGLACTLGITRETVRDWCNDPEKKDFSVLVKELNQTQERVLLFGGASGRFNAHITKLVLCKHGYGERKEISGPGGGPIRYSDITDNELDAKIRRLSAELSTDDDEDA